MASSGMLRGVALVIIDVSEELITRAIRRNIPEDAILPARLVILKTVDFSGSKQIV
jgi:hypothetical protein